MRCVIFGLSFLLGGCASSAKREAAAEARGYERGYRQAVQEQYWIIQNQQRIPAGPLTEPITP